MRANGLLLALCLLFTASTAAEEEELPPLELLGFIADFSDEEEGWVDPQEIEDLFNISDNGQDEQQEKGAKKAVEEEDSAVPGNYEKQ